MSRRDLEEFRAKSPSAASSHAPPYSSPPSVVRISASLRGPSESDRLDTVHKPKPTAYYVIVGRGTAAIVNHTTLRQTSWGRSRLADPTDPSRTLPVMHIGFRDPWEGYFAHGMGQPPHLLGLPGYHTRPDASTPTIRHGTRSKSFAAFNRLEWDLLGWRYAFEVREAWVAVIETRTRRASPKLIKDIETEGLRAPHALADKLAEPFDTSYGADLRLLLIHPDQRLELVYAHKVDLCTGAGRARTGPDYPASARTSLWTPPDRWTSVDRERMVVNGQEALLEATYHPPHERILIYGGGGIAMNIVERSDEVGNFVDWTPRGVLHQDPFDLPRNETVLRHPSEDRAMEPGDAEALGLRDDGRLRESFRIVPWNVRFRFGQHNALARFVPSDRYRGRAEFARDAKAVMVDAFGNESALDVLDGHPFSYEFEKAAGYLLRSGSHATFNRLILSIGLPANELGHPTRLVEGLRFEPISANLRMVGLQAERGAIRALGACATMYPGDPDFSGNAHLWTRAYFESLPVSAVLPGFIFSAVNIAEANRYFSPLDGGRPHSNVNTLTQSEIKDRLIAALGFLPHSEIIAAAEALVAKRRAANGYPDRAAIRATLARVPALTHADQLVRQIADALDTEYPEPLDLR